MKWLDRVYQAIDAVKDPSGKIVCNSTLKYPGNGCVPLNVFGGQGTITQAMLKDLKVPTLLIAGAADLSTPPSITRMIAAEIPGSQVVVVPESGHSVYWERPDLFNRAVLEFAGKHG